VLSLWAGAALPVRAQSGVTLQRPLLIVGRVVSGDSEPIAGAALSAAWGGVQLGSTRTGAEGHYRLRLADVGRAVRVRVSVVGFRADSDLVTPTGDEDSVSVSFILYRIPQELQSVSTVAERPRPRRRDSRLFPTPGANRVLVDRTSGLSGDLTGDLVAALATVPEVSLLPSMSGGAPALSAFGLEADQNAVTLNGMAYGGAGALRDGLRADVELTTYDPKNGRGAGLQVNWRLPGGTTEHHHLVHVTGDAPFLQWTSPASAQLGSFRRQEIVSGAASGPITPQKRFYSIAYQVLHRSSHVPTLISASPLALRSIGVNPDSVARLLAIASDLGLPLPHGSSSGNESDMGSAMARIDLAPGAVNGIADDSNPSFYLLLGGALGRNSRSGARANVMPSALTDASHQDGFLGADHSTYLGSLLTETRVMYSREHDGSTPSTQLPAASVLVRSGRLDGDATIATLAIGGNGGSTYSRRSDRWQLTNESTLASWSSAHRLSAYADITWDRLSYKQQGNALGSFYYNSLDDLATGQPSRFTRGFGAPAYGGRVVNATLAAGDLFTRSPGSLVPGYEPGDGFTLQYGLRADLQRFSPAPHYNATADSVFGVRTDRLPNTLSIEPMAGFVWNRGIYSVRSGDAVFTDSRSSVTGGIREYRSLISPSAAIAAQRATGLPSGDRSLECIGSAVPAPSWRDYLISPAAVPTECTDSVAATAPDGLPTITAFARNTVPTESWRAELRWRWLVSSHLSGSLGAIYTLNRHRLGAVDINFDPTSRFVLTDEGGRPVFVPAGSISAVGAVSNVESRAHADFGRVTEWRSDLRSRSSVLTGGIVYRYGMTDFQSPRDPVVPLFSAVISASYAYNADRRASRGFDATTAGDPREVHWGPGPTPQHAVLISLTGRVQGLLSVSLFGRISSGYRYTPLISGDVNGDGYANDRAFVFDPSSASDPVLAAGMAGLLQRAPSRARTCLSRQLGHSAAPNSCDAPWNVKVGTISVQFDSHRIGLGNRGSLTIFLNNALGGLDQLLHGGNHLRGWGQASLPDPTLLTVTGFDPARPHFEYAVNPLFGTTTTNAAAFRAPFQVTVDFRAEVGPNLETQYIELFMQTAKADRRPLTGSRLKTSLLRWATNTLDPIVHAADSLGLAPEQRQFLEALNRELKASRDSIYSDLADYLVALNGNYGGTGVRRHWHDAIAASIRAMYETGLDARHLLTQEQRDWLRGRGLSRMIDITSSWLERTLDAPFVVPH
jgi:hypothetical protein